MLIGQGALQLGGAVPGDTLVPDDITRDFGGPEQKNVTLSIDQASMPHSSLLTDPTIVTAVKKFLDT